MQNSTRKAVIVGIFLAAAFLFTWFLTFGRFNLFEKTQHPGLVYDSLAAHMWKGNLQVDRKEIGVEAFVVDKAVYTYFGPVPAFPRMALNKIFPGMYGRWSRLSLLIALLWTIWIVVSLIRNLRFLFSGSGGNGPRQNATEVFLALAAAFGSTTIFLSAGASVYHEAIGWGTCLALLSALQCVKFWQTGRTLDFSLAALCAGLAFFTRITAGLGPLALVLVVGILSLSARSGRRAISAISFGTLALTLLTFVSYNHARFNTWFDAVPIRYHVLYSPERMQRINGTFTNFRLAPQNAKAYLWYPSVRSEPLFPWIAFDWQWVETSPGLDYDLVEPLASMSVSMPALLVLAVLGLGFAGWTARRDSRPLLLSVALLGNGCALLALAFLSERYLHDWMPGILCATCLGLLLIERIPYFRVAMAVCSLLLLWNVIAMFSLTYVYQRDLGRESVPPERRFQLHAISHLVTGLVKSAVPSAAPRSLSLQHQPPEGWCVTEELVFSAATSSFNQCDGNYWQSLKGAVIEDFVIVVPKFISWQAPEPLVTAGTPGRAYIVYVLYEDGRIRVAFESPGSGGSRASEAVAAHPGDKFRVFVEFDPVHGAVVVRFNEATVIRHQIQFRDWDKPDLFIGQNPFGGSVGPGFSGRILSDWTGQDYQPAPFQNSAPQAVSGDPVITSLGPPSSPANQPFNRQQDGSSAISISGTGFDRDSRILANDVALQTTFGNSGWLTASVPAELLSQEGSISFRVRNNKGIVSSAKEFRITR